MEKCCIIKYYPISPFRKRVMKVFSRCGAIFLICCLIMAFLPFPASAGVYDVLTYEIKDNQVTITGCDKTARGKVIVPDTIEGCPVTAIGEKAFSGRRNITEIVLPETIKTIGRLAFYQCEGMTNINLPSGLTTIEYGTFSLCTSLTTLHIPATVTKINPEAFSCRKLSSLTVEEGNPVYYSSGNCVIKTVTKEVVVATVHSIIPSDGSVTSIGNYAFRGQTELKEFTVPHGITTIRSDAFFDCTKLSSFHLSDTVTNLSPIFKNNFETITTLTVDKNNPVYHISGNCIIETASKTLVRGCSRSTIPDDGSVTSIGYYAFYYSRGLTDLTIPSAVSQIGSDCLRSCKDLKSVTVLNPDAQIAGGADTLYGDITIYGYTGSTAEAYAKKYEKTFVALDPHTCTYDQKVTTNKYQSNPATCAAPATYFYSCSCGEKGTKTFTHGEVLPHTYDNACDTNCNVCNAAKDSEVAHNWDNGATTDAGTIIYKCITCNAQRVESIAPTPEVTEPTVPSEPAPATPVQTEPSAPEQDGPSLIWILPVLLAILVLLILIVFLLKRKKQAKEP